MLLFEDIQTGFLDSVNLTINCLKTLHCWEVLVYEPFSCTFTHM